MPHDPAATDHDRDDWDAQAATFDDEPDHGLRDPAVRAAWTTLLSRWLPERPAEILDLGCGTGSLSVVLAGLGHAVTGIDASPAMIAQARAKAIAAGAAISFHVMDAAHPTFAGRSIDVLLCRHLLWALPELPQSLERWSHLLKPRGRLIMIEGYWHTGGGLRAEQLLQALPPSLKRIAVESLSANSALWGTEVTDERYLVIADSG